MRRAPRRALMAALYPMSVGMAQGNITVTQIKELRAMKRSMGTLRTLFFVCLSDDAGLV